MERMAAGKWPYVPIRQTDNLHLAFSESKDFLQAAGICGEILLTPGHTDDGISLLLRSGAAFTGDLMAEELLTAADDSSRQSWATLQAKGARLIYPGHGNPYPVSR
jgi:glyoxylase-like metal-dependent hydrolase (beta-lactamase superfamily II)